MYVAQALNGFHMVDSTVLRTVRECRRWAESFGATADACHIYKGAMSGNMGVGRYVACHIRGTDGDGAGWSRAEVT